VSPLEPRIGDSLGPETRAADTLVGREREMSELLAGLQDARSGHGRLLLIAGAPGIGKTRLVDELATEAKARGATVLWGRCWEAGGAPAYRPWVQCLRTLIGGRDLKGIADKLGAGAADVAQIIPELRDHLTDLPSLPSLDPEGARFRLFDATTALLRAAAQVQPVVLVLDDLHVADTPSVLLLRFVAREIAGSPILIVAAYRDVQLTTGHPSTAALVDVIREPTARQIQLGGLTEGDVRRFVEELMGAQLPDRLVSSVYAKTEGNPLFVGEVVRLLAHEGRLVEAEGVLALALPEMIREVIARRVEPISPQSKRVLSFASVLGREFDLDALSRVMDMESDEVLQALDEPIAARIVSEVPGALARLRFAHVLIRETLYQEITPAHRARLHRWVGEALESLYGESREPHLAELAHHFFQAAPGGDVDRAVRYARAAGDRAVRLLAYEEAVRLYRMALEALDLKRPPDEELRCALLLALGDALIRAGDGPSAKETFLHAAQSARDLRVPELLAQAALGYGGRFVWARARGDRTLTSLLEEALSSMGPKETGLRARVLARLAGALRDDADAERRDTYSRQAVEIARRLGDASTLAYALSGRSAAIWLLGNINERLAVADELLQVAERAGDRELAFEAHTHRYLSLVERGDIEAAQADLEIRERLAGELGQPAQHWNVAVAEVALASLRGHLDRAEEAMWRTLRLGERAQSTDAALFFAEELFVLRKLQGRLEEIEESVRRWPDENLDKPIFLCLLGALEAELFRNIGAAAALDGLHARGYFGLSVDNERLLGMGLLAEAVRFLDDRQTAAQLYDRLQPFAHLNVAPGEICMGSVSRYLGVLAATLTRFDEAQRHFAAAVEMNTRMSAQPWLALAQYDWALMLLARDGPGDRDRAEEMTAHALRIASDLGMAGHADRASVLQEGATSGVDAPPQPPKVVAAGGRPNVFRREGEYWSVAFEGEAFRLKDAKGLRYLARLLALPGREIHALDLVGVEEGVALSPGGSPGRGLEGSGLGDAGEILDDRAKAAYRIKLKDLEEDLVEAEGFGDIERAAKAKEEIDFLTQELAAAVGLSGKDRVAASAAERARVNVTRAIKAALVRVREHSPTLGKHLQVTVRTGTFCSYTPDPRLPVSWKV